MKAGIYEDLTYDDYAAIDAMNHTRLSWLIDESPAYFQHKIATPEAKERPPLKFGKAAHCATLESDVFTREYALEPDISTFFKANGEPYANPRASKAYKEAVAELVAQGSIVLAQPEFGLALQVAEAVRAHPRTGELLKQAKGTETTLVWERDGMSCKARLDFWGEGWIADLKTTSNFNGFSPWEITKWKLYRQLAWYQSGAIACGLPIEVCYLAVVSSDVPEVALFALELGALQAGEAEIEKGWSLYLDCCKSGVWPGRYPDDQVLPGTITDKKFDEMFEAGLL